jgi:hypothetical protein
MLVAFIIRVMSKCDCDDDGCSRHVRNVDKFLPDYTAQKTTEDDHLLV